MAIKTIKHGYFWYSSPETVIRDGEEKQVFVERTAFQNESVEITRDSDLERGEKFGAFYTDDELEARSAAPEAPAEESTEATEVDLSALDDDELVDWLMSTGEFDGRKKPNGSEVVEAVGDNPELAKRVLAAENTASGGDPRNNVEEPLNKVAEGDQQ
jgi:hypothetical protein